MTSWRRDSPGSRVWLSSKEKPPEFFENEGAWKRAVQPAPSRSKGRWLEAKAGIRTRGHLVALTVAAQRRLHTGLSLFSAASMRLSMSDSPPDATILLQRSS